MQPGAASVVINPWDGTLGAGVTLPVWLRRVPGLPELRGEVMLWSCESAGCEVMKDIIALCVVEQSKLRFITLSAGFVPAQWTRGVSVPSVSYQLHLRKGFKYI